MTGAAPVSGTAPGPGVGPRVPVPGATRAAATRMPPPYDPGAYAGIGPDDTASARRAGAEPPPLEPDDDAGTSPWIWVAGVAGLLILAIAGFLLFRLITAGSGPAFTPGPGSVTLPSYIGQAYLDAFTKADDLGVTLAANYVKRNDAAEGTIVGQDPPAGTSVTKGSTVKVDVVSGKDLVSVPSIVGMVEGDAIRAITDAKLRLGARTEDFDPTIPAGSIIGQGLPSGLSVPTDTPLDYIVSRGPEPTPSPSASPSPSPTPVPSPSPEPSLAPSLVPTPVPSQPTSLVGTYVGLTVAQAKAQATAEGFVIVWQGGGSPPESDLVVSQNPPAGSTVNPGSSILLNTTAPPPSPSP